MANDDVTLRLGGDAEGAKRATDEASRGLQGLGAAAGGAAPATDAAARGLDAAGEAAEAGGKAFHFGGAEAERLAMSMQMAGLVAPQLQSSLSYLLQAALNPATLGFGAAVLAVQGLMMAFRASAAETEAEKQRMQGLVQTYADATKGLEDYLRARGAMTAGGERAAREAQLRIAAGAGVEEAEALAAMEALPGANLQEQIDLALAVAGQPAPPEGGERRTAAQVRRLRERRPETFAAYRAAGAQRLANLPSAAQAAARATGLLDRESNITPEDRVVADLAAYMGVSPDEARDTLDWFTGQEGAAARIWQSLNPLTPDPAERFAIEAERVRGFAESSPRSRLLDPRLREVGAGTAMWAGSLNVGRYVGMEVNMYVGSPGGRSLLADGKPRGPQE